MHTKWRCRYYLKPLKQEIQNRFSIRVSRCSCDTHHYIHKIFAPDSKKKQLPHNFFRAGSRKNTTSTKIFAPDCEKNTSPTKCLRRIAKKNLSHKIFAPDREKT